nr:hypothetical protein [Tanacetum cinerariifolium]
MVFDPMESSSPHVVVATKLPILNLNEFDLLKMRIEQYFLITNYSLWKVILNGDSPTPTKVVDGIVKPIVPTTVEQRLAKKNELKARGTFLMALPDKHQLQKLISQLEILGESLSQEDINLYRKFESGGASGNDGCGDDEKGADEDKDGHGDT